MLLLRLGAEQGSEERKRLRANIGEWVEGERLENLQDREEILLEPVFEVPHEKVRVGDIRMEKGLVAKVPGEEQRDRRDTLSPIHPGKEGKVERT